MSMNSSASSRCYITKQASNLYSILILVAIPFAIGLKVSLSARVHTSKLLVQMYCVQLLLRRENFVIILMDLATKSKKVSPSLTNKNQRSLNSLHHHHPPLLHNLSSCIHEASSKQLEPSSEKETRSKFLNAPIRAKVKAKKKSFARIIISIIAQQQRRRRRTQLNPIQLHWLPG